MQTPKQDDVARGLGPLPTLGSIFRSGLRARLGVAVLCAVGVAAFVMALLFGANRLILYSDLQGGQARVAEAFARGDLTDANYAHGNTIIGGHQFNDCLILGMALDQPSGLTRKLSISPLVPGVPGTENAHDASDYDAPCLALHELARNNKDVVSTTYYHRYLHGQVVLARYLLPPLGVAGMRLFYKDLLSLLLLIGFSIALVRLVRRRSDTYIGYVIAFACFARFFGIGEFGQSLGHGPSDALIVIYLLFTCLGTETTWGPKASMPAAAAFGALTMVLELLTGGLPLGAAVIIGTTAMMLPRNAEPQQLVNTTLRSLVAFLAAAVTCVVLKLAASVAVFGPAVLGDYGHQLQMRMALTKVDKYPTSPLLFLQKLLGGLSSLAEYSRLLAGGTILLAAAAGIWGLRSVMRSRTTPLMRTRVVLLALSTIPVLLWFPLFGQHTIQHAWFMDRILVWTVIVGFWLFTQGFAATSPNEAQSR